MRLKRTLICMLVALGLSQAMFAGRFIASANSEFQTQELRKIVFRNGNVDTYFKNGDMDSYEFSSLQRIYYSVSATENPTEEIAVESNDGVVLFPNPARNEITIRGLEEGAQIKVMDATGQTVLLQKGEEEETRVDISNLRQGIYFVLAGNRAFKLVKK